MSKHKALDLAEKLRTRNGNAAGFGLGPVCDEADATIRAQHALIVQMREALTLLMINSSLSAHQLEIVIEPIAAADQYLGEKP